MNLVDLGHRSVSLPILRPTTATATPCTLPTTWSGPLLPRAYDPITQCSLSSLSLGNPCWFLYKALHTRSGPLRTLAHSTHQGHRRYRPSAPHCAPFPPLPTPGHDEAPGPFHPSYPGALSRTLPRRGAARDPRTCVALVRGSRWSVVLVPALPAQDVLSQVAQARPGPVPCRHGRQRPVEPGRIVNRVTVPACSAGGADDEGQ